MNTVKLRNLSIGGGDVKICYPITSGTREAVLAEAVEQAAGTADLVEWRLDYFEEAKDLSCVLDTLAELRKALQEKPLLFVFRTPADGGHQELSGNTYFALNRFAIESGNIDMVDLQSCMEEGRLRDTIKLARRHGVKTLISHHDYGPLSSCEQLREQLLVLAEHGGDMVKLAVKADSEQEADRLIAATEAALQGGLGCPAVSVAMGAAGKKTRRPDRYFGNSISYSYGKDVISEGQYSLQELAEMRDRPQPEARELSVDAPTEAQDSLPAEPEAAQSPGEPDFEWDGAPLETVPEAQTAGTAPHTEEAEDLSGEAKSFVKEVEGLAGEVEGLAGEVEGLAGEVEGLAGELEGLAGEVEGLAGEVEGLAGKAEEPSGFDWGEELVDVASAEPAAATMEKDADEDFDWGDAVVDLEVQAAEKAEQAAKQQAAEREAMEAAARQKALRGKTASERIREEIIASIAAAEVKEVLPEEEVEHKKGNGRKKKKALQALERRKKQES